MSEPDLSGRTAVVTGGADGIGRATAKLLARHGAKVYVGDHRPLEENEAPFTELGIVQLNLRRPSGSVSGGTDRPGGRGIGPHRHPRQ